MALPTAPSDQRTPSSPLMIWLRKFLLAAGRPLFAVILAMIFGIIVIMITSPGSPIDRFNNAIIAYQTLFGGAFGNGQNLSFTLVNVTPLILTGLSVAIAFRAGLFNIGAAGQLAMGGMTAGVIAFTFPNWPAWLLIPTMLISSILVGAIWGGIVGFLKAWRGAHEVVTTIMLNWIAFYFTDYLIDGPYQTKHGADQTDALPAQATLPHIADFYNSTLGTFLPKIANATQYLVDVGFFFSLAVLVLYWFIVSRTTFGYEIRVIGQNLKAAKYAGIPIKRNLSLVMAIAGGFSGLAGALELMGQFPYTLIATDFAIQTTGFDAIGVALLGRMTAVGVLLGALLFGGLRQGGTIMQLNAGVPGDLVYIIQALVLFSIAAQFLPIFQRRFTRFQARRRKPALAPAKIGGIVEVTSLPKGRADDADKTNSTSNSTTQNGAESLHTVDSLSDTASSDRTE
jgi:general nucleoside transport system permease protein